VEIELKINKLILKSEKIAIDALGLTLDQSSGS
jgi:hypothetical protein